MKQQQDTPLSFKKILFIAPLACLVISFKIFLAFFNIFRTVYQFFMAKISYIFMECSPLKFVIEIVQKISEKGRKILNMGLPARVSDQHSQMVSTNANQLGIRQDSITDHQKLLIYMDKLQKLECTIYQQSADRRKAEQESFDLNAQLAEKELIIMKERNKNMENSNRIQIMSLEMGQVKDQQEKLLEKNQQQQLLIEDLQTQVLEARLKLQELKAEVKSHSSNSQKNEPQDLEQKSQGSEQSQKEQN